MRLWHRLSRCAPAGLCLLLTACPRQQATAAPPPPPKVTVSQPVTARSSNGTNIPAGLRRWSQSKSAPASAAICNRCISPTAHCEEGDLLFVIDPRPYQAELIAPRPNKLWPLPGSSGRRRIWPGSSSWSNPAPCLRRKWIHGLRPAPGPGVRQAARAAVEAAQLNVEFTQVKAPISGRISRNLVTVGNLINGGTAESTLLTTIVSLDPIYCYFEVDERSYLNNTSLAQRRARHLPCRQTACLLRWRMRRLSAPGLNRFR